MTRTGRWAHWGCRAAKHSNRRRTQVEILPFEIQQWLRLRRPWPAYRLHFTNHNQMIARNVFGVNLAIQPMQTAADKRIAQRRLAPFHAVPLVRTAPGKLVGNPDLVA